jgi:hypothetical protein
MLSFIKNRLKSFFNETLDQREFRITEKSRLLAGKIKADYNRISCSHMRSINDFEFSVFSQFGEDGIIQYLIDNIEIKSKTFVEFGVENYKESNTRFLMMNNNWGGLVLDGGGRNIAYIQNSEVYWRYDLQAKVNFITKENINDIIAAEKITGEIGLLSVDIDGADYWVWQNISVIEPDIVIVEYNSLFGPERTITVPYRPDFDRIKYHYSALVFGASLAALVKLGDKKGYYFVGCNEMGNNAFFVKKKKIGNLKPLSIQEGFKEAKFRESRDKDGQLSFLRGEDKYNAVKGVEVYNTETGKLEPL